MLEHLPLYEALSYQPLLSTKIIVWQKNLWISHDESHRILQNKFPRFPSASLRIEMLGLFDDVDPVERGPYVIITPQQLQAHGAIVGSASMPPHFLKINTLPFN